MKATIILFVCALFSLPLQSNAQNPVQVCPLSRDKKDWGPEDLEKAKQHAETLFSKINMKVTWLPCGDNVNNIKKGETMLVILETHLPDPPKHESKKSLYHMGFSDHDRPLVVIYDDYTRLSAQKANVPFDKALGSNIFGVLVMKFGNVSRIKWTDQDFRFLAEGLILGLGHEVAPQVKEGQKK